MTFPRLLSLPLALMLLATAARPGVAAVPGEGAGRKKAQFTLLNPTPVDLMRDLSTDRPDQTESAYTVDAGHFQLEMDFLNYARDHDTADGADVRSRA